MEDIIVVLILIVIVTGIIWYLYNSKKQGEVCVGCPYSKQCGSRCNSYNQKVKDEINTKNYN
ncbi:MAG: FeoB-associated Cys-rich membrane protein [Bacillota bacterium]|jgi:radical SAM protein with 4Fe4S-binding SPASM domain|nr:FeoB-associated Cys-rich membrane protein [Bacillota bacterium]NLL26192.1 FeoB-associated Cys-rich membrane protein [Erysipelotrichia bacterium]